MRPRRRPRRALLFAAGLRQSVGLRPLRSSLPWPQPCVYVVVPRAGGPRAGGAALRVSIHGSASPLSQGRGTLPAGSGRAARGGPGPCPQGAGIVASWPPELSRLSFSFSRHHRAASRACMPRLYVVRWRTIHLLHPLY
ncbi:hypothetical protein BDY21DRAFT_55950 [Lineolata rhizophorae]|uniref:Uncharacterized protein n=1 Tax=Lineolata rhizophorae TaxID=578093 RepID=A0A6A6NXV2_9PEZI|nr:hypothetical protein BDY21DRAFT_55950 [Lineolata rhizophorae]